MQVEERQQILKILIKKLPDYAEILEKQIFTHTYHRAEELRIPLDWNSHLFLNLYQSIAFRIIKNIKYGYILKYLQKGENVLKKKDTELSDIYKHLIAKESNSVGEKFLKDTACDKCGKYTVKMQKVQLRSMDEGFSAIFKCFSCNRSRTEN